MNIEIEYYENAKGTFKGMILIASKKTIKGKLQFSNIYPKIDVNTLQKFKNQAKEAFNKLIYEQKN